MEDLEHKDYHSALSNIDNLSNYKSFHNEVFNEEESFVLLNIIHEWLDNFKTNSTHSDSNLEDLETLNRLMDTIRHSKMYIDIKRGLFESLILLFKDTSNLEGFENEKESYYSYSEKFYEENNNL